MRLSIGPIPGGVMMIVDNDVTMSTQIKFSLQEAGKISEELLSACVKSLTLYPAVIEKTD